MARPRGRRRTRRQRRQGSPRSRPKTIRQASLSPPPTRSRISRSGRCVASCRGPPLLSQEGPRHETPPWDRAGGGGESRGDGRTVRLKRGVRSAPEEQLLATATGNVAGRHRGGREGGAVQPRAPVDPRSPTYRGTLQSDRRRLFEHFTLTDVAHKVVGVGSVGTRTWILLFESGVEADVLLLQANRRNVGARRLCRRCPSTLTRASVSSPASI